MIKLKKNTQKIFKIIYSKIQYMNKTTTWFKETFLPSTFFKKNIDKIAIMNN